MCVVTSTPVPIWYAGRQAGFRQPTPSRVSMPSRVSGALLQWIYCGTLYQRQVVRVLYALARRPFTTREFSSLLPRWILDLWHDARGLPYFRVSALSVPYVTVSVSVWTPQTNFRGQISISISIVGIWPVSPTMIPGLKIISPSVNATITWIISLSTKVHWYWDKLQSILAIEKANLKVSEK
jgi:hypothetical protein